MKALWIYYLAVSAVTFMAFGIDKRRAVRHKWRISEEMLLILAGIGGAAGALLAMPFFHHKTRKKKFTVLSVLFFILHLGLLLFITVYRTFSMPVL